MKYVAKIFSNDGTLKEEKTWTNSDFNWVQLCTQYGLHAYGPGHYSVIAPLQ